MKRTVLWFRDGALSHKNEFTVVGFGVNDPQSSRMVDRMNGTDDYLFMHFPVAVQVFHNGELRDFPAHTFFLWTPGNRHTFGNYSHSWDHRWMHCKGRVVEWAVKSSGVPLNQPIFMKDMDIHERALNMFHHEVTTHAEPDWIIMESIMNIWIREIARVVDIQTKKSDIPEHLIGARKYTDTHFTEEVSLSKLASAACLSTARFCSEFSRCFGISPMQYVKQLRLEKALYYLHDQNLSVQEVSEMVGIKDSFYFSRIFKQVFGMSPLKYKQQCTRTHNYTPLLKK